MRLLSIDVPADQKNFNLILPLPLSTYTSSREGGGWKELRERMMSKFPRGVVEHLLDEALEWLRRVVCGWMGG